MKKKKLKKYLDWDFEALEELDNNKVLYKLVFPGGYKVYLPFKDEVDLKKHIDKMEKDVKDKGKNK